MKITRFNRALGPLSSLVFIVGCAADLPPATSLEVGAGTEVAAPGEAAAVESEAPKGGAAVEGEPAAQGGDEGGYGYGAGYGGGYGGEYGGEYGGAPAEPAIGQELSCGDAPLWWHHTEWNYGDTAPLFDFSPNGALLVRGGIFSGTVYRASDGANAGSIGRSLGQDSVSMWSTNAGPLLSGDVLEVQDLTTGLPLYQVTVPAFADGKWYTGGAAAISQDGSRLVALSCTTAPGSLDGHLRLTAWEPGVYTWAHLLFDVPMGFAENCLLGTMMSHRDLRVLPDGSAALVASGGTLSLVDLTTGAITTTDLGLGEPLVTTPPVAYLYTSPFVSMAASPDGTLAAVVAEDGLLRILALPSLAPVGAPIAVPIGVANACTYIPTTDSPVAFSADGSLLAHMGEGASVVVRRASDLEIVETLAAPEGIGSCDGFTDFDRTPQAIRFSADGARIAIAYEDGVALWGCGEAAEPVSGELTADVWGSTALTVGQLGVWSSGAWGGGFAATVTIKRWTVDGEPVGQPSMQGTLSLAFDAPGEHTISMEADDGLTTATATISVTVQ